MTRPYRISVEAPRFSVVIPPPNVIALCPLGHMLDHAQAFYNRLECAVATAFNDVLKIRKERKVAMRAATNMLGISRVAGGVRIRGSQA